MVRRFFAALRMTGALLAALRMTGGMTNPRSLTVKSQILILALCILCLGFANAVQGGPPIEVRGGGVTVELSANGQVVEAKLGQNRLPRAVTAETALAGCRPDGKITIQRLDGGVEFQKPLLHEVTKNRCLLVERFLPTKKSVRWEIEIHGQRGPWTTDIVTRLQYPDARNARLWTAWSDPDQHDGWQDPLVLRPFADRLWNYNGGPGEANLVAVPITTIVEPAAETGFSLVLSPEDILLDQTLNTSATGRLSWTRSKHRIVAGRPLRFAMDLVSHAADWRGGLAWMVARYPAVVQSAQPAGRSDGRLRGLLGRRTPFRRTDLHRMAFRINWKCSEDFPYMGMFLPPLSDDERYLARGTLSSRPSRASRLQLLQEPERLLTLDAAERLLCTQLFQRDGVRTEHALARPAAEGNPRRRPLERPERLSLRQASERRCSCTRTSRRLLGPGAWWSTPGDPAYQKFLLEQAQRHIDRLPAADGICIDRMDWLRYYNPRGDDGVSWVEGKPARSYLRVVAQFHGEIGADDALRRQGHLRQQPDKAVGGVAASRRHLLRVRPLGTGAQCQRHLGGSQAAPLLDAGPGHAPPRPRRLFPTAPPPGRIPNGPVSGQQPLRPAERLCRPVVS